MESTREEERDRQQELHGKLREIQDELSLDEDSVATVRSALDRIITRKSNMVAELSTSTSRRSAVEVEIQECELSSKSFLTDKTKFQEQLEEVENLIQECELNMSQVEPKYEESNNNLSQVQEEIFEIKQRIESLYGKQGRGRQFSSKKERDTFLQSQVETIVDQVKNNQDLLTKLTSEVEKESLRLIKEKEQFNKIEFENKSRHIRYEELSKEIKERTLHRNKLQEKRKSSWRDLEGFQEQIQESKQELDRGKQQLNAALPRNITQGLATVDRIAAEKKLTGYYGPLIDNFSLKNDALRTSVEVAAGNALFHVIVDTDETAALLMKELEKRKAGRLTFLPLNRIRNPDITYPDSNDVRPLMEVALDYDADFEEAIKQVFGKKLLARDLETAAIFSKECQLDAITTEGDQVNRRGGFEGGYHDERTSKIGAIMKIRESTKKIKELQESEEALKLTSDETDTLVNNVMRELQKLETEREHLRSNSDQLTKELSSRSKQLDTALEGIKTRRDGLSILEKEIITSQNSINQFESEMKSPLVDKLSENERNELKTLSEKEKVLQSSIETIETELNKISIERERLKADLKNNLTKRKDELNLKLTTGSGTGELPDFTSELADLKVEKSHIKSLIASTETEINEIDEIFDSKRKELSNLEKEMEVKKVEEIEYGEEIAETTKMQDKILNKRKIFSFYFYIYIY
jgi:structural maintenance of chromosome 3 (chondroitin sulfate proteoglycan 6)